MKHNILWGIILLVASLSFTAKAQKAVQGQFSVKGVLLDSLSNEGEPYSTIRISLKNNPVKPVKLAVTGADGRFDERLAVPGTYLIHFTSVGKSGSPDKPGGLSIQLCKSEKKEFYIRYSS